jgi:photosystem II stability/assembly factor-like uncharacterized protein
MDQQILRTTDGGESWTGQISGMPCDDHYGVAFADADRGIIVGYSSFQYTADGGQTWSFIEVDAPYFAVSFFNDGTATAVGLVGLIKRSTDGGASWRNQQSRAGATLRAVSFVDANNGTAVGDFGTIVHTTTGGD